MGDFGAHAAAKLDAAVSRAAAAEAELEQSRITSRTVAEQRDNCMEVCERLEARVAETEGLLGDCRAAIEPMPSDALGEGYAGVDEYPLRDDLVDRIGAFLAAAPPASPPEPPPLPAEVQRAVAAGEALFDTLLVRKGKRVYIQHHRAHYDLSAHERLLEWEAAVAALRARKDAAPPSPGEGREPDKET